MFQLFGFYRKGLLKRLFPKFCKLGVLLAGVLVARAPQIGVYSSAPDFGKRPLSFGGMSEVYCTTV